MVMVNSMRKLWRKFKYKLIQLLRIRTGAHQIALGFVTVFFPCWFPTFGVGAALSIGITKLIKGNMLASLISATFGSILWLVYNIELLYHQVDLKSLSIHSFAAYVQEEE